MFHFIQAVCTFVQYMIVFTISGKNFPIFPVFFNSCKTSLGARFLFNNLEFLFSNLELPQGTTKFIHHCHCDLQAKLPQTLLKCYHPKYLTKVLWHNKDLQGILKTSGKQIGNNCKRYPCISGSLLSRLTFTFL